MVETVTEIIKVFIDIFDCIVLVQYQWNNCLFKKYIDYHHFFIQSQCIDRE